MSAAGSTAVPAAGAGAPEPPPAFGGGPADREGLLAATHGVRPPHVRFRSSLADAVAAAHARAGLAEPAQSVAT